MSLNIVLHEPEIPQNTGNIARTCAATNATLHLIEPLGFSTDDKQLKRAGLDYWHDVTIMKHADLDAFMTFLGDRKLYLISKFAETVYSDADFTADEDVFFIFGKETTGLPEEFMREHREDCLRIPMDDTHVRSLNLSNTACMIVYEALRQQGFPDMERTHLYEKDKLK